MNKNKSFQNNKRQTSQNRNRRQSFDEKAASSSKTFDDDESRAGSRRFSKQRGSNDPAWYATDANIMRDAASLPFAWATGVPYDTHDPVFSDREYAPGVMTLELMPTFGWATKASDPVNIAAMSAYTFVRKNKAGDLPFDAPDLMVYMGAMSQVYSYINFLMRLYGLATLYTQQNRYIPNALITANYVQSEDLINHLADFRYGINVLINKASSIVTPSTMTIFQRHAFLYQNVYTDGESIKDQLYMYVPFGFYKYSDGYEANAGSALIPKLYRIAAQDTTKYYTVERLIAYGHDLIDALVSSPTCQTISAFILEAYGENNVLKLMALSENYPIVPIYNAGVMEQFKNATVFGSCDLQKTFNSFAIWQDESKAFLKSVPTLYADSSNELSALAVAAYGADRVITVGSPNPQPEEIMETTRLTAVTTDYTAATSDTPAHANIIAGSEVAIIGNIWNNVEISGQVKLYRSEMSGIMVEHPAVARHGAAWAALMSHFRFHPKYIHYTTVDDNSNAVGYKSVIFNLDNYTVVSDDVLRRMHEAALMNELNVPHIGKLS